MKPVSQAERSFIVDGCNMGIRYDGRDADSFRTISIENSILPQVNGSSRLKIDKSTDVICSVKLEISETRASKPDTGILQVNVDISPSCNIYAEERNMQAYETLIEQRIQSMLLSSNSLNMTQFCILSGKYCWKVHLDFLILKLDGEPSDACCMAAYTALDSTVIPATRPIPGESGLLEDFDVEGDLSEGSHVSLENFPVIITLSKVGKFFVVDASGEEQQCASCVVSVAVDRYGNICGLTYLQAGLLSIEDIKACKNKAYSVAMALFTDLDKYIQNNKEKIMNMNEKEGILHPDVPLTRLGLLV